MSATTTINTLYTIHILDTTVRMNTNNPLGAVLFVYSVASRDLNADRGTWFRMRPRKSHVSLALRPVTIVLGTLLVFPFVVSTYPNGMYDMMMSNSSSVMHVKKKHKK